MIILYILTSEIYKRFNTTNLFIWFSFSVQLILSIWLVVKWPKKQIAKEKRWKKRIISIKVWWFLVRNFNFQLYKICVCVYVCVCAYKRIRGKRGKFVIIFFSFQLRQSHLSTFGNGTMYFVIVFFLFVIQLWKSSKLDYLFS